MLICGTGHYFGWVSNLGATNGSKIARKGVLIALGIICVLLVGSLAYFVVADNSAQNNSYNNLENQNKQLQTWLNGNETLLNQTQTDNANLQNQVASLNSTINSLTSEVTNLTSEVANLTNQLAAFLPNASSTYFAITNLTGTYLTAENVYNGSGSPPASVLLNSLAFDWTPVRGDASDVRIFIAGMTNPEQIWWVNPIKNGTSTYAGPINLESPVIIQKNSTDGTYDFPILMEADQANGTIILQFNATRPGGNFIWIG
jgi:cell division protein FtsB